MGPEWFPSVCEANQLSPLCFGARCVRSWDSVSDEAGTARLSNPDLPFMAKTVGSTQLKTGWLRSRKKPLKEPARPLQ